jgi:acetyl esterase/lipase
MFSHPMKFGIWRAALVFGLAALPVLGATKAPTAFLPAAGANTGGAVLIISSTGTKLPKSDGEQMAVWLQSHGIAGFVIISSGPTTADDVGHALQFVRAHAAESKISPNHIGLLGFGDGAALAADAVYNHPVSAKADAADPVEKVSGRPDFMALIWGSAPLPAGAANVPPTFLAGSSSTADNQAGMVDLWGALRQARVPVDAHFFAKADPGAGLAADNPSLSSWPDMFYNWVRFSGFLTDQPRVPLKGFAYLDGRTLPHGYVILTPLDGVGAGPIVARVINSTAGVPMGQFDVPAKQGPTPGRYRVDVRQNMNRWLSNSFTNGLTGGRGGANAAAVTFGHYRILTPSIDDQHSYTKVHPSDPADYVIEIKADPTANLALNLGVFSRDTPDPAPPAAMPPMNGGLPDGAQNPGQTAYLEQIKHTPNPVPGIPEPILLWPEGAPGAKPDANGVFTVNDKPGLYAFPALADHNTGAAFLVLPGGGLTNLCMDNEGVQIARFLNRHGIAGFVLNYRIGGNYNGSFATMDSHRAMQYLRAHAADFKFLPDHIGVIGFSAGAELEAGSFMNGVDPGVPTAADPLSRLSTASNFNALIYGGVRTVRNPAGAPPTFMFNTLEDGSHLSEEIPVLDALRGAKVPVEAHWYQVGPHGTSMSPGDPELGQWPELMVKWLQVGGLIPK